MSASNQPVSFEVRGDDAALRAKRHLNCETTLQHLNVDLSQLSETVVCLIDDQDCSHLRHQPGAANRGLFSPLRGQELGGLIPHYFLDSVTRFNCQSWKQEELFNCLIYVHGSTSSSEVGLTLTLAHELQHFVQYATDRPTWAVDRLLAELPAPHSEALQRWTDFPIEREARVVAKRVAFEMYGQQAVTDYIRQKLGERINEADVVDWKFLLSAESDAAYRAVEHTRTLVRRFRSQLIALQRLDWSACREVQSLDFDSPDWQ